MQDAGCRMQDAGCRRRNDCLPPAAFRLPMTQSIGIYGGTFDPVHHGHLILARDAMEQLNLARMIFVPAAISPHKLARSPDADGAHRLAMLRAATAGEERFAVDPCELGRAGPSYTVDTLLDLRRRLPPETALFYLIGEDNVPKLDTWHRIAELRALATFVVFRRADRPVAPILAGPGTDFPTLARRLDLSATEIRNRVAAGRSIRYFVPESVAAIIDREGLYRPTATITAAAPKETPPLPPNS